MQRERRQPGVVSFLLLRLFHHCRFFTPPSYTLCVSQPPPSPAFTPRIATSCSPRAPSSVSQTPPRSCQASSTALQPLCDRCLTNLYHPSPLPSHRHSRHSQGVALSCIGSARALPALLCLDQYTGPVIQPDPACSLFCPLPSTPSPFPSDMIRLLCTRPSTMQFSCPPPCARRQQPLACPPRLPHDSG